MAHSKNPSGDREFERKSSHTENMEHPTRHIASPRRGVPSRDVNRDETGIQNGNFSLQSTSPTVNYRPVPSKRASSDMANMNHLTTHLIDPRRSIPKMEPSSEVTLNESGHQKDFPLSPPVTNRPVPSKRASSNTMKPSTLNESGHQKEDSSLSSTSKVGYRPVPSKRNIKSFPSPSRTVAGETREGESNVHSADPLLCEKDVLRILQPFGIPRTDSKKLSIIDIMRLDSVHLKKTLSYGNVVVSSLIRLMSYDYRAMYLFKEIEQPKYVCSTDEYQLQVNSFFPNSKMCANLSCRDFVHAVLQSCDPFLQQEILSKMSACNLAVPIILPNSGDRPTFVLWGIQNITKAWRDPCSQNINAVYVSHSPYPVVSAVRFGDPGCSKSNILNTILGKDQHPYFCSREQDVTPSVLSKGTLEALWYSPSLQKNGKNDIRQAVCFLNLRGDALELTKQMQFVCKYTMYMIVFVDVNVASQVMSKICEIAEKATVLVILSSNGEMRENVLERLRETSVALLDTSQIDIFEQICNHINKFFSCQHPLPNNLESMSSICKTIDVACDILHIEDCSKAKKSSEKILRMRSLTPLEYKRIAFPLQLNRKLWCQLDKYWRDARGNTEKKRSKLNEAKQNQGRMQRLVGSSNVMILVCEELLNSSASFKYRQFLVFWLQHLLNKACLADLHSLLNDMRLKRRNATRRTGYQTQLNASSVSRKRGPIQDSARLQKILKDKSKTFNSSFIGLEHFFREFGQMYECSYDTEYQREQNRTINFDFNSLPPLTAEMLLGGHSLELFDGDTCHVPVEWLKGVFGAVREITGDVLVSVISMVGIQGSGKSTLLNSMFGTRFPVRPSRCTRGVFMQLLPISDDLKNEIGCNFIAVIDTEKQENEENELSTFALCLSDVAIINIGGQTVGAELSSILKMSAHAFIWMKEGHDQLSPPCYLMQQCVPDIPAEFNSKSRIQSIIQQLNDAVMTAAKEEGKRDQYRRFSDCFNIVNILNEKDYVRYIPNLWSRSMSSPNPDYSEHVMKLKSNLLGEIRNNRIHKISDFEKRICCVWEKVKDFKSTREIDAVL